MKKILLIIILGVLVWLGYKYVINTSMISVSEANIQYIVKTRIRTNMPGEDITVQDKTGNIVLSLVNQDPQYVYKLIGNNLILDIGTSAGQRILAIYDIPSQTKIFESDYYPGKKGLSMNDTSIQFSYKVRTELQGLETRPTDAPNCSALYNGYTEIRTFDLTTKQLLKTGTYTCAYFE